MWKGIAGWVSVGLAGAVLCAEPGAGRAGSAVVQTAVPDRGFLQKYCVTCHGERPKSAGIAFDQLDLGQAGSTREIWERVVRELRSGTMPPAGQPRPDRATHERFIASLEAAIDRAAAAAPNPGRSVTHRLNRAEYANTIRDLLHLEIDASSLLPADESLQGFDNIGGALSISPSLLERYMSAARRISRLAVGDATIGPAFAARTYVAPPTVYQDLRMSNDLPFGSRGGIVIRHYFPLDAEYVCRIRLQRTITGYVRGLGEPHQLEVRLDGRRITAFTVGGEKKGTPAPVSFTGVIFGDPTWEAYALTADAGLEIRFRASAGTRTVGISFVEESLEEEGVLQPPVTGLGFSFSEAQSAPAGRWGPAMDSVTIDGPYNASGPGETPSRQRIFVCGSREEGCAKQILSTLARRAYRRPVMERDIERLLGFFKAGQTRGGFEAGIQAAIERLLVDPNFLFRIERDPEHVLPGAPYQLSDLELASRLSFFLWSSIPDDQLLDEAVRGTLRDPAILERHIRRMLTDSRAKALVENFAGQWLSLRQLEHATPDPDVFREFDGNLREAFKQETMLFVESQLREDRSVLELLTANYTFVNERLARHYGIPGIYGSHFRRVPVNGEQRGGLLAHGGMLTITSYPLRTSPVLRGRWLLDNILGTPPAPPPADIPPLPPSIENDRPQSMRERMERHRRNPMCAGCHVRMDPLGFALENFDPIGKWRSVNEAGAPIDASGSFPDGTQFRGLSGLRTLVLSRREEFARTVTNKLLTYALGRAVEYYDMPTTRAIVREAAPHDYHWSSLILGVVRSAPFQMRRAES